MKLLVLVAGLLALGQADIPEYNTAYNYHVKIGITEAGKIRQGESSLDFDGRIIGGSAARLGDNPHLGGLVITLTNGWTSVCGSSLLSNTRAVTAAHCWWDGNNQARQFVVVLGSLTLFSGGTRITTTNVRMHENWNWRNAENDVAVITINWVGFNNNIRSINLASGSNLYVGTWALASGYGMTSDSQSGVASNTSQRQVNVRVIDNNECRNHYREVVASTICTSGSGRVGTCGGDSGGPLNVGTTLIGITSFGSSRCEASLPSAYARVSFFNSWIRARM